MILVIALYPQKVSMSMYALLIILYLSLFTGWCSFNEMKTAERYGIPCNKLEVGDVCLGPKHPETFDEPFNNMSRSEMMIIIIYKKVCEIQCTCTIYIKKIVYS